MRDLLFAAAWLLLIPLAFVSSHVGVLVWTWSSFLSPNELVYGAVASVPFIKIAALVAIGMIIVKGDGRDVYVDPTLFLLGVFATVATVSWLASPVSAAPATDLYGKIIKEIVLVVAITAVFTTRQRIEALLIVTAASLGFLAVKEGLLSIVTLGGHQLVGNGAIGDNNALATALLMATPLMIFLARHSTVRIVGIGYYVAAALAIVTVVATFSRGGFIGLLAFGALMIKNSRQKVASTLAVLVGGVLIYLLAPASWFARLNTIETANQDGSFMGRVVAWKMSWLVALDRPLFGGGPHAIQYPVVWDAYRERTDQMNIVATPPADTYPHAAHSIYFELLGDFGFTGLTVFLVLMAMAFYNCRWIRRASRDGVASQWTADLARMLQISLVVYLVTGAALSMAYFELAYVLVAILSRCRRNMRLEMASSTAAQPTWKNVMQGKAPPHPDPALSGAALPAPVRAWQGRTGRSYPEAAQSFEGRRAAPR